MQTEIIQDHQKNGLDDFINSRGPQNAHSAERIVPQRILNGIRMKHGSTFYPAHHNEYLNQKL